MAVTSTGLVREYIGSLANSGTSAPTNSPFTSSWYDLTGSGSNGTLTDFGSPSSSCGWAGSGTDGDPYRLELYESATDTVNYVNIGTSGLSFTSAMSCEAWIYPRSSGPSSYPRVVDFSDSSGNGWAFYLTFYNSFGCTVKVGSTLYDQSMNGSWSASNWYHVVWTYTDSDDYIRLYVNASTSGTSPVLTGGGNIAAPSGINCHIGNRDSDDARQFDGGICTVRLYNIALSSSQVTDNYNAGKLAYASTPPSSPSGYGHTALISFGIV